ncbi:ABC transporter permease subunit [Haloarchaeobius salinus]|uniref:ABC transporter permease subunit n=1 Tax=Haloarchaeobius salinus TaxID=1198298 RepID=UPI00210D6777|nr:ABC transporter permease [Haloarchaeobius salinus]
MHRDALHPTNPRRYLAARIAVAGMGLLTAVSVCFAATRLGPASPLDELDIGPVNKQPIAQQLGVDADPVTGYLTYVDRLLVLDPGKPFFLAEGPAEALLVEAAPNTAVVVAGALALVTVVAVPVGLVVGTRDGRVGAALETLPLFGRTTPNFLVAALFVAVFGGETLSGRGSLLAVAAVIAAGTLVASRVRAVSRAVRKARRDGHVDAARAKGLSRRTVCLRHLAPVALLTHLRRVADDATYLVGAVVVIETVLAPSDGGLGFLFLRASTLWDFPLAATLVVLFTAAVVAVRLLGDLALALVDPRVGPRADHN